jgi:heme/copper-type cytochrome/quinol oxidase subunit 2
VIFLLIFGTGAQAGSISENGLTEIIMFVIPLIIVGGIAFKVFKKN